MCAVCLANTSTNISIKTCSLVNIFCFFLEYSFICKINSNKTNYVFPDWMFILKKNSHRGLHYVFNFSSNFA